MRTSTAMSVVTLSRLALCASVLSATAAANAAAPATPQSVSMAGVSMADELTMMLSRRWFDAGASGGAELPAGALAREVEPGFSLRLQATGDVVAGGWARLELALGLARLSRKVAGYPTALVRVPMTASVLVTPPWNQLLSGDVARWPAPYLRLGAGPVIAIATHSADHNGVDVAAQWGVGARYVLPWERALLLRLELTHTIQPEAVIGHFIGVTLGFDFAPRFDRDGDGVVDRGDRCPSDREDFDDYEDGDGCPDRDNDGDGIADDDDACPNVAEDKDGFEDGDGCPDDDNDADGVPDGVDVCPTEIEDVDGFEDGDGCPDPDNDADGIIDARDRCPMVPEDEDGFDDLDGCPDPDNDQDGIPDVGDACPEQPEDFNGVEDDDGCPDAIDDGDGDGIVDASDACPEQQEDHDGFEDDDGCADPDNDKDGVPDIADACPLEPEDVDRFEDQDGCPDSDNDGDGILDTADECPDASEVINGVDDDDGCPDEGTSLVKLSAARIATEEKVTFESGGSTVAAASYRVLDQVAAVIKSHATIVMVRIEAHANDGGSAEDNLALSQQRAEAVRRYLMERGVAADRLQAVGYGENRPIASNRSRVGRDMNRRIEFRILRQQYSD